MKPPNPGYPSPRGVWLTLRGGTRVRAYLTFDQVVLDNGVPTPRWLASLPGDMNTSVYTVESMDAEFWPPGTIIAFDQRGNASENAERIVAQSRRAAFDKLMMRRGEQR